MKATIGLTALILSMTSVTLAAQTKKVIEPFTTKISLDGKSDATRVRLAIGCSSEETQDYSRDMNFELKPNADATELTLKSTEKLTFKYNAELKKCWLSVKVEGKDKFAEQSARGSFNIEDVPNKMDITQFAAEKMEQVSLKLQIENCWGDNRDRYYPKYVAIGSPDDKNWSTSCKTPQPQEVVHLTCAKKDREEEYSAQKQPTRFGPYMYEIDARRSQARLNGQNASFEKGAFMILLEAENEKISTPAWILDPQSRQWQMHDKAISYRSNDGVFGKPNVTCMASSLPVQKKDLSAEYKEILKVLGSEVSNASEVGSNVYVKSYDGTISDYYSHDEALRKSNALAMIGHPWVEDFFVPGIQSVKSWGKFRSLTEGFSTMPKYPLSDNLKMSDSTFKKIYDTLMAKASDWKVFKYDYTDGSSVALEGSLFFSQTANETLIIEITEEP